MSRILPLSPEAVSQIQSSKQITSLQSVVFGLLENSLDAGANKIELSIDWARGGCTVEDNGQGIPSSEFLETGGLARMYHTSKHPSAASDQQHGNSGTFLAALAALSFIQIRSSHSGSGCQATLTLHQGKVVSRDVPPIPFLQSGVANPSGTCVGVRDLYGNMPVRVKQRSLNIESGHEMEKDRNHLKRGIVALLLAWPTPCSVCIRDQRDHHTTVNLSGSHPAISAALTEKSLINLSNVKPKYDINDALPILWQAGMTNYESRSKWIPVSATTPDLAIKGSICLVPVPTQKCQFISIGVRPCFSLDVQHSIYDSVNKLFINSSFGVMDVDSEIDEAAKERRKHDRRFKTSGYTRKQLHGRKGVDRWPMFVFRIGIRDQQQALVDVDRMSDARLKAIDDVLSTMITQWLTVNHFRPRKQRRKNEAQKSPASSGPVAHNLETHSRTSSRPRSSTPSIAKGGKANSFPTAASSTKRKMHNMETAPSPSRNCEHLEVNNARDYFHSWSRIKSGRMSFYENLWNGNKPATALEGQTGTKGAEITVRPSTAFDRLRTEAGALSTKRTSQSENLESSGTLGIKLSGCNHRPCHDVFSDDFGSWDDSEMRAAVANRSLDCGPAESNDAEAGNVAPALAYSADQVIEWTDSVSKQTFQINGRTGVIVPSTTDAAKLRLNTSANDDGSMGQSSARELTDFSKCGGLSLTRRPRSNTVEAHRWLPEFLDSWKNPVFVQQDEPPIPTASSIDLGDNSTTAAMERSSTVTQLGLGVSRKLSKTALRHAKVIAQVDRKYILCNVESPNDRNDSDMLVLIDQHAASERVILENLLHELCTFDSEGRAKSTALANALRFDITDLEYEKLNKHRQHFEKWGILFDLAERNGTSSAFQVRTPQQHHIVIVRGLPAGIAERCALVPKLVIELLRTQIWAFADKASTTRNANLPGGGNQDEDDAASWLNRIGSCPKGILDMLNSRACRSAVMFNDALTMTECQSLVADLSRCAFPFICAHGRVSMVPIADLVTTVLGPGHGLMMQESNAGLAQGFAVAFNKWKGRDRHSSGNETN